MTFEDERDAWTPAQSSVGSGGVDRNAHHAFHVRKADFFRGRRYQREETTQPSKRGEEKKGGKGVEERKEGGRRGRGGDAGVRRCFGFVCDRGSR